MNQLKFWHIALLLSIWSLTSCSDDNNENEAITPFCLGDTYYEVRLGQETNSIYITNGSGDISLAIEDENILQATYNGKLYADKPGGVVSLFGKQKGSTMLSIIDNVTGIVLPNFRPAERGFKSRISRQCEPDSSLG